MDEPRNQSATTVLLLTTAMMLSLGAVADGSSAAMLVGNASRTAAWTSAERQSLAELLAGLNGLADSLRGDDGRTTPRSTGSVDPLALPSGVPTIVPCPVTLSPSAPAARVQPRLVVTPHLLNLPPPKRV